MKKILINSIFIMIVFIFASCAGVNYRTSLPQGFAGYSKEKTCIKAISSNGNRIKIYKVANDPYGEAGMWFEAVNKYLKATGYVLIDFKDKKSLDGLKGFSANYKIRYNAADFDYNLGLYVDEKNIYILEGVFNSGDTKKNMDDWNQIVDKFQVK